MKIVIGGLIAAWIGNAGDHLLLLFWIGNVQNMGVFYIYQ